METQDNIVKIKIKRKTPGRQMSPDQWHRTRAHHLHRAGHGRHVVRPDVRRHAGGQAGVADVREADAEQHEEGRHHGRVQGREAHGPPDQRLREPADARAWRHMGLGEKVAHAQGITDTVSF